MRGDEHGETVTFLRAIVRNGYRTIDSYEEPMCFYCGADAHKARPAHRPDCVYLQAKRLLRKMLSHA